MSFEFISFWYSCFASPDQVRIYRAYDGEKIIGFLPLIFCKKNNLRILKELTNEHCYHSGPLCRKGNEKEFPGLILNALLKDRYEWDLINLNFLFSFSDFPDLFSDSLLDNRGIHWNKITRPTYTVFLGKTFDDYFNNDLSAKFRKNIKMYINRLKGAGDYSFKNYRGEEALGLWHEFVRIEDSGWKGNKNSSIKRTKPVFKRYYDGLIKILSERKVLHLYFLELNNELIAGGFGYLEGDTYHCAKTGYDEKYKALSPSNLLIIYLIEHLIINFPEIKRINIFPINYGYKHRLINEKSSYLETVIFSKTIRGKVMRVVYYQKEKIKYILRRLNLKKESSEAPRIWKSN
ncbi:MAG: GNAT family N-acetyltransferase [Desulfobacteraceae bacterium]